MLAFPVRLRWKAASSLIWFWTLLELGNGVGHVLLAIGRKGYFPGVITAPLLLLFAGWLLLCIAAGSREAYVEATEVSKR